MVEKGGGFPRGALSGPHPVGVWGAVGASQCNQPLDSGLGRACILGPGPTGDGFSADALSLSGGDRHGRCAGTRTPDATDSNLRPMGGLPDFPPLPAPARVLRWPQRLLWRGLRDGLPGASGCFSESSGGVDALPVRPGPAATRLAARAGPGDRQRMDPDLPRPCVHAFRPPRCSAARPFPRPEHRTKENYEIAETVGEWLV
jgi:hypothetical protein